MLLLMGRSSDLEHHINPQLKLTYFLSDSLLFEQYRFRPRRHPGAATSTMLRVCVADRPLLLSETQPGLSAESNAAAILVDWLRSPHSLPDDARLLVLNSLVSLSRYWPAQSRLQEKGLEEALTDSSAPDITSTKGQKMSQEGQKIPSRGRRGVIRGGWVIPRRPQTYRGVSMYARPIHEEAPWNERAWFPRGNWAGEIRRDADAAAAEREL